MFFQWLSGFLLSHFLSCKIVSASVSIHMWLLYHTDFLKGIIMGRDYEKRN